MKKLIKSIIVIAVLLLSGCYVQPPGFRHGNHSNDNSYNRGYGNSYSNNVGYYRNGSQYPSGYQNNYSNRDHHRGDSYHKERGEHHHDGGYHGNNSGGQHWQGGQNSGYHGRH